MMAPTERELRMYAAVDQLRSGKPRREVCRDFGISAAALARWVDAVSWWESYSPCTTKEEWKAQRGDD